MTMRSLVITECRAPPTTLSKKIERLLPSQGDWPAAADIPADTAAPFSVAMFCGSHGSWLGIRARWATMGKPAAAVGTSGLGGEGTERHTAVQLPAEIAIDDTCFVVIRFAVLPPR